MLLRAEPNVLVCTSACAKPRREISARLVSYITLARTRGRDPHFSRYARHRRRSVSNILARQRCRPLSRRQALLSKALSRLETRIAA